MYAVLIGNITHGTATRELALFPDHSLFFLTKSPGSRAMTAMAVSWRRVVHEKMSPMLLIRVSSTPVCTQMKLYGICKRSF